MTNLFSIFKSFQAAKKTKTFITVSGLENLSVRELDNLGYSFHKVYNYEKDFLDFIRVVYPDIDLTDLTDKLIFEADLLGIDIFELSRKQAQKRVVSIPPPPISLVKKVEAKAEETTTKNPVKLPEAKTSEIMPEKIEEVLSKITKLMLEVPDLDKINELINDTISKRLEPVKIRETVVINGKNEKTVISGQHYQFNDLLKLVSNPFRSVWVNGEAGTGKTYAVEKIAEALKLNFYAKSCGNSTQTYEFLGYNDAKGTFVETDFYKAYKNGGIFCLDEIDNSSPNVLSVLNSALSNSFCSFANGMQRRHKDFKLVATANTTGNGATAKYVGRLKIDDATKDRFNFLFWGIDEKFERDFSGCSDSQYNSLKRLRAAINDRNLHTFFSVRSLKSYVDLIALGFSETESFKMSWLDKQDENIKASLLGFNQL